jgi:hypothetical protein
VTSESYKSHTYQHNLEKCGVPQFTTFSCRRSGLAFINIHLSNCYFSDPKLHQSVQHQNSGSDPHIPTTFNLPPELAFASPQKTYQRDNQRTVLFYSFSLHSMFCCGSTPGVANSKADQTSRLSKVKFGVKAMDSLWKCYWTFIECNAEAFGKYKCPGFC